MNNQELDRQNKEIYQKTYAKVHAPELLHELLPAYILEMSNSKTESRLQIKQTNQKNFHIYTFSFYILPFPK